MGLFDNVIHITCYESLSNKSLSYLLSVIIEGIDQACIILGLKIIDSMTNLES